MVILALDPSTVNIGCALCINGRQWHCWTVDLTPPKGEERSLASLVREKLCEKLPIIPDVVGIEATYVRHPGPAKALVRVQGMIEMVFAEVPVYEITAAEARKRFAEPFKGTYYEAEPGVDEHQIAALRVGLCLAEDIAEAKESEHETDERTIPAPDSGAGDNAPGGSAEPAV